MTRTGLIFYCETQRNGLVTPYFSMGFIN